MRRQLSTFALPAYSLGRQEEKITALTTPSPPGFGLVVLRAAERKRNPREGHEGVNHLCLFLRTLAKQPRSVC